MKKLIILFVALFAIISMQGCASNFVRPSPDALTMGKSTGSDIKAMVGKPTSPISSAQVNGVTVDSLMYYYNDGAKFWGLIIPQRLLTYTTFNDVMVGEEFNSTMDGEVTEFDVSKVPLIEKGKSTKEDVIAQLGKPSGKFIFPLTHNKDETGLIYSYTYGRFAGILTTSNDYRVIITLNDKNIVTYISYMKDGKEQLPQ